jgi:hypothetical protein
MSYIRLDRRGGESRRSTLASAPSMGDEFLLRIGEETGTTQSGVGRVLLLDKPAHH